ncbi:hypothetical protein R4467_02160 [Acinetobacter baumannii]|nr:hypothetical protein [Acinetobacter baumannii]
MFGLPLFGFDLNANGETSPPMADSALNVPKFGLATAIPNAVANNTRLIRIFLFSKKENPANAGLQTLNLSTLSAFFLIEHVGFIFPSMHAKDLLNYSEHVNLQKELPQLYNSTVAYRYSLTL